MLNTQGKDYLNHGDQDEILVHCFVQNDSPYSPGRANYIEITTYGLNMIGMPASFFQLTAAIGTPACKFKLSSALCDLVIFVLGLVALPASHLYLDVLVRGQLNELPPLLIIFSDIAPQKVTFRNLITKN
jgi:hypothetical protein